MIFEGQGICWTRSQATCLHSQATCFHTWCSSAPSAGHPSEAGLGGRARMLEEAFPRSTYLTLFPSRTTGSLLPFGRVMLASNSCFHWIETARVNADQAHSCDCSGTARILIPVRRASCILARHVDLNLHARTQSETLDSALQQPANVRISMP